MKRETRSFGKSLCGIVPLGALAAIAAFAAASRCCLAAEEFQLLLDKIPRSANTVVLLNMDAAKASPLGVKENWSEKIDHAFESGISRVPPQAKRFILAAQIDFEFMEPLWEAAVIEMNEDLSSLDIRKARPGSLDTIEGLPAVVRRNDTYLLKLAPKLVAAMGPANRQAVVRWMREVRKPSPPPLSPYLERAARYSDKSGSQIIMAIDLEGVFSLQRISKYLKADEERLKKWGADLPQLARLLDTVQGARIGVRIGEEPSCKIVIDVGGDASIVEPYAKSLILMFLSDRGAAINDMYSWTAKAQGNEISLAGKLSKTGLRRLMSVVDSPAAGAENDAPASPGEQQANIAKASLKHFRAVNGVFNDLKSDMRDSKTLGQNSYWFDKGAKRIERMPILDVDPELLRYSAFVAQQLRQASLAVKTMGIQSSVRQAQITGTGSGNDYSGGYRYGAYGSFGVYGPFSDVQGEHNEMKAVGAERRVVRAEEREIMNTNVQDLRQKVIAATADIRRKMTQKYQMEF